MALTPEQALQKGIEAHKSGKVLEADRYYTAILKTDPRHPDANHNMGVLAVSVGKVEQALPFFKKALEANQSIAQFWLSYISALIKLDRLADAKSVLNQAKSNGAKGDGFDKLEIRLAEPEIDSDVNFTQKLQEPTVVQLQSLINLNAQDRSQEALDQAVNLLKQFPNSINLYNIVGSANQSLGKLDEAIEAYKTALSIKPDFAQAYYNMGNALKDQGKLQDSLEAYSTALFIKPDYAQAQNNMGVSLQEQGKIEEAVEAYKKAIAIKPNYAQAWLNGAEALEKWNKIAQLEIWLNNAANSFANLPADLKFMKSKLLWRHKRFDETFDLISNIKFETISEIRKKDYLNLKAKCFEKSKSFDEAYKYFAESNSWAKKSKEYKNCQPDKYFQNLNDSLSKIILSVNQSLKVQSTEKPEFSPTFLVGFPRSGTTLLDTILRSNSRINVVEEQDMLRITESFLNKMGHNDFESQLLPRQINIQAQKIYRNELKKHTGTILSDKVYIDKLPLNLLKVPLIHQLFPDAKIIVALRHPMDIILSCWMQNFKLNAPMANMVDLDRTVDFYCIAMKFLKICRTNYSLNVHEIRYEDLINDFQKESEAVVKFLNLQWEPEMKNYQDTALRRGRINTPSYSQVIQPIYKDAKYRWLNYTKYLEQYLAKVEPWISEFGYD